MNFTCSDAFLIISIPSMNGMQISVITTSGRHSRIFSYPSLPSDASATTTQPMESQSVVYTRPFRIISSSSAIKTRSIRFPPFLSARSP